MTNSTLHGVTQVLVHTCIVCINHLVGAILNDPQNGDCWSMGLIWNLNLHHSMK
jgi:hypothetical protein